MSPIDIEEIIDSAVDDVIAIAFEEHFTTRKEVAHALNHLKGKINDLEVDDFEDILED